MLPLFSIDDFMPTEEKCVEVLRKLRWPNGLKCIYCKSKAVVSNGKYGKYGNHFHKFWCRGCGRSFSEKTGTIFMNSNIPLREWFYITRELEKGVSINRISQDLNRRYGTVMEIAHKVMEDLFMKRFVEEMEETVEIDELYHSAGQKGTKCEQREPRKRGLKLRGRGTWNKDKPPIVGKTQRNGKLKLDVLKNATKKKIRKSLKVKEGSTVYTDDFTAYIGLDQDYKHDTVNHSEREYARGDVHTNTIEGIFQDLRHWLNTFKGVCKKNLKYYVNLFEFRYNIRNLNPFGKLQELLSVIICT